MIILETIILSIGLCINLALILNIIVRPVLWSTINTFIGCLLFGNFLYLTFETFLIAEDVDADVDEHVVLTYFEFIFADDYKSIICAAKYISQFLIK